MRELKFRVFDKGINKMYFPNEENDMFLSIGDSGYFQVEDHSSENCELNPSDLSIVNSLDDDLDLMQYTGLKDKNGKDIYEGDIVEPFSDQDDTAQVMYKSQGFGFYTKTKNGNYVGWNYFKDEIEIIGNIHENPELL